MFTWKNLGAPGRPAVMGIVNVTPDSFSDGGRWFEHQAAVVRGVALAGSGAAVLDVGGESTRPGAAPVAADEEMRRVLPVVEGLVADAGVPVSVDTAKPAVAAAALAAGAAAVNDVTGARDPEMLRVVADHGAGLVLMHMRGEPRTMQDAPHYDNVVREVGDFLAARVDAAVDAGIAPDAIIADPGIGFGKTVAHNCALLGALPELADRVGVPLLVGASRKRFLGALLEQAGLGAPEPEARDDATLATVVWCALRGVSVVRVHDAPSVVRAVLALAAMQEVAA